MLLQQLLPGLRELRAPLMAGYLWLLGLWLLLRNAGPADGPVADMLADVIALATWVGKPATFVALTFIAYLIGIVSRATAQWASRRLLILGALTPFQYLGVHTARNSLQTLRYRAIDRWILDRYKSDADLRKLVYDRVEEARREVADGREKVAPHSWEKRVVFDPPRIEDIRVENLIQLMINRYQLLDRFDSDIATLRYRILGVEKDLHAEYDRLRSEGDLRSAIAPPTALICVAAALTISPWFWFALIVPLFFANLGAEALARAEEGLVSVAMVGRVELPSLRKLAAEDLPLRPVEELFDRPDYST
jgi:hypothetical protein